ncbi:methionine--tRNA ligase [Ehrlichia ruminantium]|uniref:Methionine--tRNA ligase n=1 Tax=Ehrlichia ruminantium TaxID=779 RepID=A0AAE6UIM7_EHRRU|nr:methionine--tRNA ligase [Ehrlichia ruminantium]QGR02840.1 methionine--tRNA ligase [Ehrlichia ruminantium]QGR03764.1 methionine--tRNA ligase [Ehrlichia ruminantium]QGR04691.1 methionine--tRNA ligase [Ehrlichia ruminantium]
MKSIYITTPIYYVNDVPHIGHVYTTLISDIIARFKRLDGYNVKFVTGTDEHGQKIEKAAQKANKSLIEFTDNASAVFRSLADVMTFSYDDFIRTTEARHKKAVKALWTCLYDYGEIYLGNYSGWYAIRDETFYQEKELIDGKAPTGAEVEWVEEPSYFFRLSRFQERLLDFYEQNPDFIVPKYRYNEVVSFVKSGLKDISISRQNISWGINVPNDDHHVIYVWIDALTNYLTVLGFPDVNSKEYQDYWLDENNSIIQVVGKDILRFHAIYWPAMLMAAKLPLPKKILAHGWWTNTGQKISKSLGNVINPFELIEEFGVDQIRYFLIKEMPVGNDGDYKRSSVINCINCELANNIGNLVQRTVSLLHKECSGIVPEVSSTLFKDEDALPNYEKILESARICIDQCNLNGVIHIIEQLSSIANEYITFRAPWKLSKTDPIVMQAVLYKLLEYIRCIGLLLQPIMPSLSAKILDQISLQISKRSFSDFAIPIDVGIILPKPEPIIAKIL